MAGQRVHLGLVSGLAIAPPREALLMTLGIDMSSLEALHRTCDSQQVYVSTDRGWDPVTEELLRMLEQQEDVHLLAVKPAGAVAASGAPSGTTTPKQVKGDLTGGLSSRPFKVTRQRTARGLVNLVGTEGVVLVRGPPQTGKTSLLELTEQEAEAGGRFHHIIRVSMTAGQTLDDALLSATATEAQPGISWSEFWGSPRSSACSTGRFKHNPSRLLLIDEAQLIFLPGQADGFWKNMKGICDASPGLPNVCVVMFAMLGDQPSGSSVVVRAAATSVQLSKDKCVDLFRTGAQHNLMVALDDQEECPELWTAYIESKAAANPYYRRFFVSMELRDYIYQVTRGHVGLIASLMDKISDKLDQQLKLELPDNPDGFGDMLLRHMFTHELYRRLAYERCVLSSEKMEPYKFFFYAMLHADDDGMRPATNHFKTQATELRLKGMIHVDELDRATFITPFHRNFYLVWVYTLPGMQVQGEAQWEALADEKEEFRRFKVWTVGRMRKNELRRSYSIGGDGRLYERHYQVEWYRAARSYLPLAVTISPDVGQVFGTTGRVDFWIRFPNSNIRGWAVELLRDGDRAQHHLDRFEVGGLYHGMPLSQKAVMDFRLPNRAPQQLLPGMTYVVFAPRFVTATVILPDGAGSQVVALA